MLTRWRFLPTPSRPLHFPLAFPEVYHAGRGGFHVAIGNPPWDKVQADRQTFWAARFPGLRSRHRSQADRDHRIAELTAAYPDLAGELRREADTARAFRSALLAGPYPGLGNAPPDYYVAFAWRFHALARPGGWVGLLAPRGLAGGVPTAPWRAEVLARHAAAVTYLTNTGGWLFPDVTSGYTVVAVNYRRTPDPAPSLTLDGPYRDAAGHAAGRAAPATVLPSAELGVADGAPLPLLPAPGTAALYRRFAAHPRIADGGPDWAVRAVIELGSTSDKPLMHLAPPEPGAALLPVLGGAGFRLWEPDTGERYAHAEPDRLAGELQARRLRQARYASSVMHDMGQAWAADPATLPLHHPRIAFRNIASRRGTRTVIAALLPAGVALTDTIRYLLLPRGGPAAEAYLLGLLASRPLDWFARCHVELHLTRDVFNRLPVPAVGPDDPRRRRIVAVAGRLAACDDRFAGWASQVGVGCGPLTADEQASLQAELDAQTAHLYGLDEGDLRLLFATFHPTRPPTDALAACLPWFHRTADDPWAGA